LNAPRYSRAAAAMLVLAGFSLASAISG